MEIQRDGLFHNLCTQSQTLQEVKNEVSSAPVTAEKRALFHKALEELQKNISKFNTALAHPMWKELNTQVISLYAEVENRFDAHQVAIISSMALGLKEALVSGKIGQLARSVSLLQAQVSFFLSQRCPSLQDRKIIAKALELASYLGARTHLVSQAKLEQMVLEISQLEEEIKALTQVGQEWFAAELYELFDASSVGSEKEHSPVKEEKKAPKKVYLFIPDMLEEEKIWSAS